VLLYAGIPALVTAFLWVTSSNELSFPQILAAFLLCWIPWAAYEEWYRGPRQEIPLFSLLAAMYWLTYVVPLFWSSHTLALTTGVTRLREQSVTEALYLVLMGVAALWAGMRAARGWRWRPSKQLDVPQNPWRWHYLRMVLVLSAAVRILVPITALGEGGRQVLVNIESVVPSVVFVILLRSYLRGHAIGADKALLAGYFLLALIVGLSSGWLGTFVALGIICITAFVYERRQFPVAAILVVLPVILFLQPGKARFRERYWQGGGPSESYAQGYSERVGFWLEASAQAWGNALTDLSGEGLRKLSSDTLTRLSLLQQTANVIEMTPRQVPYQDGRLYSYVPITFVPRFLWPAKPSISDANKWYQISYHLTLPANLESVGIAVGTLTESYINFGWLGPVAVMFCLGFGLGVFQTVFLRVASGMLLSSIGVALLPGFLSVESQMAVYVAGLVQQVAFALIILAPVLVLRSGERGQGRDASGDAVDSQGKP